MTTRVLLAYGLIAAFAAGGLLALWFGVWRQRLACRRRRPYDSFGHTRPGPTDRLIPSL